VISTNPAGGTQEAPGTPVNIVVSVGTTATLQTISVTPANPSISKGTTQQFTATGNYNDGSTQPLTNLATWASVTTSTATITARGLATGAGTGTSSITARYGIVQGSTTLTVTAAALVSIAVTPANPSVGRGSTKQFTATGTYTDGTTSTITAQARWTSGTTGTATITSGGLATAVGAGSSAITAALNGIPGSTTLTVTTACDVDQDGLYSASDAQTMINQALGKTSPANDLYGNRLVNVVDIQIATNAALYQVCVL
jgi:hypothetical protein